MRMLLPLDGSVAAEAALPYCALLRQALGAEVVLARVVAGQTVTHTIIADVIDWQMQRDRASVYLDAVRARLGTNGTAISTVVLEGSVAGEISRLANTGHFDLVVLTETSKAELPEGTLGGTVGKVITRLETSLLLVQPVEVSGVIPPRGKRLIVVPLDGSPGSSWAASVAASVALATGARLLLLRVVEAVETPAWAGYSRATRQLADNLNNSMRAEADHWLRVLRSRLPEDLEVEAQVLVEPSACRAIRQTTARRGAHLLVMSAHGMDADKDYRYGEVTEHLLAHAPCPILVLQRGPVGVGSDVSADSGVWRIVAFN